MDIKGLGTRAKDLANKYKYAVIVALVGIGLLLIPQNSKTTSLDTSISQPTTKAIETEQLTEILQSIQGAGKVKVLLSIANGEEILYQTDNDVDNNGKNIETVILTDAQRAENGLVTQINPPKYLGAIVVCEGADHAAVRLAVTQAVAKITGLSSDNICVLKMES